MSFEFSEESALYRVIKKIGQTFKDGSTDQNKQFLYRKQARHLFFPVKIQAVSLQSEYNYRCDASLLHKKCLL